MSATRREFIGQLSAGAALLGGIPFSAGTMAAGSSASAGRPGLGAEPWDLSWVKKLRGKHRAVFDVPEIESGYGVWRASIWVNQYRDVLGVKESELSPVLVLRHNGIVLAMQQSYWDRYGVGKAKNVLHPVSLQSTDRNPALLSSKRNEQPEMFDGFALDQYLARGGIALACSLAFQEITETIKAKDGVGDDEASKRGLSMLIPGVVMQPSGVFAAIRAQEAGCTYLRAS
jgi:hypothetical protein